MAFDSLVRVRMPDGSVIDVGQSYAAALGLEVVASTTPLTSVPDPTYAGPAGTKGELVVGGANGLLGRLTPGGANRVLVADPTQPLGVKWAIAADQFADLGTSDGQMTAVAADPDSAFSVQQSASFARLGQDADGYYYLIPPTDPSDPGTGTGTGTGSSFDDAAAQAEYQGAKA